MIRLIATDVDGTIAADGSCEINPEYYTVIRKLRALGIQVAAASGRQKDSLLDLFAPVKEKIFYISNNGAGLGCWNRELYVQGMPPELIHELMADVAKLPDCQMILSGVDTCFYSPETEDWFIRYLREDYHFEALPLPENMEEIDLSGIVKIAVYHDPSDTEPHPAVPLIRKMEGRLSGMVSVGGQRHGRVHRKQVDRLGVCAGGRSRGGGSLSAAAQKNKPEQQQRLDFFLHKQISSES